MDATNIRKGSFIKHKEELWQAVEVMHRTPGNKRGFVQVKLRSIRNGTHITERFASNQDVDSAWLDTRKAQYLYDDPNTGPVFMDSESFEQYSLDREILGDAMHWVKENDEVEVTFYELSPIGLVLPAKVDLVVTDTEPAVKGDTVNNVLKPATLETGVVVKVPAHIRVGDKVRVSTASAEFQERVND
ncbi:MAG: elongation factor P [Planctomycetota bacterium]|nr:elongation factor P [Planctomycetota bacterium]